MAAFLLTACASETPTSQAPDISEAPSTSEAPSPTDDPDASETEEAPTTGNVEAAAAVDIALRAVPGAVVEAELDRERGTTVWEVGVLGDDGSGTEVTIDSQNGNVLKQERLRLSRVQSTAPQVTAAEAIEVALDTADGQVIAMDLDTERGTVVWEVEVVGTSGGTEIYIDAGTGAVLKQERMS
ncbi:PepSY domain-containing protein [Leucobacter soli]